jgi:hypothetical protein
MMIKGKANRVVLFGSIDREQHDTLRYIAYRERRSIADIVREAISQYLKARGTQKRLMKETKTKVGGR